MDRKNYYGFTKNIDKRVNQHNSGEVSATKYRKPLDLIYFEKVDTVIEARKREKYFKSGFGRKYLKNQISKALSSNG